MYKCNKKKKIVNNSENMGHTWLKCLLFASVWCFINCYNIRRVLDNENDQRLNLEIDFYPSIETRKFVEDLQTSSSVEAKMFTSSKPRDNYDHTKSSDDDSTPLDSWSVVWYIASFGGLIIFFLIVSCSEWCCRRAIQNSQNCTSTRTNVSATPQVPDTPPPSYDQFAPPSYESICLGRHGSEKSEYDIYVVPVHALGTIMEAPEDAPPSYYSASTGQSFVPAVTR